MRINFYISGSEQGKFVQSCEAVLTNICTATLKGTTQACQEILAESQKQVPRDTETLASTGFYEVQRRMATKRYTYEGIVGYAGAVGAGASHDKLNPKSGVMVSEYATRVHEDLTAWHLNGGNAKFLENPVRAYGQSRFKRVAETNWRYAIETSNAGGQSFIPTSY
jgi:hypothetical protein